MSGALKKLLVPVIYISMISIVIVVACYSFFKDSAGWFAINTKVSSDGMRIEALDERKVGIGDLRIYKVDEDNLSASRHDNPTAEELNSILTLNQYDSVFQDKREHTPIILKTTLTNFMSGTAEETINVTISLKEQTAYLDGSNRLEDYISNLICIACSTDPYLSDDGVTEAGYDDYYVRARDFFWNPENQLTKSFVNYESTGEGDITLTSKNAELTFEIDKPADVSELDVYMFFSYDEKLINKYANQQQQAIEVGDEVDVKFQWGEDISFKKDLALIKFTDAE